MKLLIFFVLYQASGVSANSPVELLLKDLNPRQPKIGDPIFVKVALKNLSDRPIKIMMDGGYEGPSGYHLTAWKCKVWKDSVLASEQGPAPPSLDAAVIEYTIPPNQEINPLGNGGKLLLNHFLPQKLSPGKYQIEISAYYQIPEKATSSGTRSESSTRFDLSLAASSADERREAYESLLNRLKSEKDAGGSYSLKWAVSSLAQLEYVDLLLKALDEPHKVGDASVKALGRMGKASDPAVLAKLLEVGATGTGDAQIWSLVYLREAVKPEHLDAVISSLDSENHLVRFFSLVLLQRIGTKGAIRAIANSLYDPSPQVRKAAASHLKSLAFAGSLGDLEVVLAREKDPDVKREILLAIEHLKKAESRDMRR